MRRKIRLTVLVLAAVLSVTPFICSAKSFTWVTYTSYGDEMDGPWFMTLERSTPKAEYWHLVAIESVAGTYALTSFDLIWYPSIEEGVIRNYTYRAGSYEFGLEKYFSGWKGYMRLVGGQYVLLISGVSRGGHAFYYLGDKAFFSGYRQGTYNPIDPSKPFVNGGYIDADAYTYWMYREI